MQLCKGDVGIGINSDIRVVGLTLYHLRGLILVNLELILGLILVIHGQSGVKSSIEDVFLTS